MSSRVVVLDYGSGNIRSAHRALERAGAEVTVTADRAAAVAADGLVIPGVGAYAACMAGLEAVDARAVLAERLGAGAPVLGICVGMQVLFDSGVEHGEQTAGLGAVGGSVTPLAAPVVPHMGWNTVAAGNGSVLFDGLPAETRFYFVHSYAAHTAAAEIVTTTTYGETFVSAVESGVLAATQFHPEKSGDAGAHLLENWVKSL
ncbi:imidazole glycerol phosphate synthase subunit HisH [Jatrophihabitans sp. YIM 134969]